MADAEARFVISVDTADAQSSTSALGGTMEQLKEKITAGSKALAEMQAAASRLRASADVLRFEEAGKGLAKAQADVQKFEARITALQEKLGKTSNAKAISGITSQLEDARKGLAGAQDKSAKLAATREKLGQSDAVKAYKDVTAAIKDKQGALAGAQAELSRMGGTMADTATKTKAAATGYEGFVEQIGALKAAGPIGIAIAIGAAFVAVGVVIAHTTYTLLAWITTLGDAARTSKIFADATARSEAGGEALLKSVNAVYQRVGGVRGEIQQLALDLRRLGLEGQALESSVEAVSAATKVFGSSSGAAIKGLIDRAQLVRRGVLSPLELRGTGLAFNDVAAAIAKNFKISMAAAGAALRNGQIKVEDFTRALRDATRARTGEALKQLALSQPEQFARARDNLEQIFKIDPGKILVGLHSVLGLLDESTETGKILRSIVKTIFQPIIDFVGAKVFPILRGMMLGAVAALLELAIAAVEMAIIFKRLLPPGFTKDWDLVTVGFYAGIVLVGLLTTGVVILTAAALGLVTAVAFLAIPFVLAFGLPLVALGLLIYGIYRLYKAFSGGEKAGASLVDGIISGVLSKAGDLFKTIASLATGGLVSFDKAAQIHSPARLYKPSGRQVAAGVAEGVTEGAPLVDAAVSGLVDPGSIDATGTGRGGGSSVSLHVTIDARGATPGAAEEKRSMIVQLVDVLEDALRQAGGTPIQLSGVEVIT